MVTLTENAIKKVKGYYAEDKTLTGKSLRVLVQKGGCSGMSYGFTFDAKKDDDAVAEFGNLTVLVDPESGKFLSGSVIDYKESVEGEGFVVSNPHAKSSCGCGHSFSV